MKRCVGKYAAAAVNSVKVFLQPSRCLKEIISHCVGEDFDAVARHRQYVLKNPSRSCLAVFMVRGKWSI